MQLETLDDTPAIRAHFVASHGMLAVLEVLQVSRSRDILGIFLRLVNLVRVRSALAWLMHCRLSGAMWRRSRRSASWASAPP